MTTAVFVGHVGHERTQSNTFFKDILAECFGTVSEFYFDPDMPHNSNYRDLIGTESDAFFFFQSEQALDSIGQVINGRTFLVPMYDAAVARPEGYWRAHSRSTFISFSQELHRIVQSASCDSILVQYFPEPSERSWSTEAGVSGFFWERRPGDQYNAQAVLGSCRRLGLSHLHIHVAPDFDYDPSKRRAELMELAGKIAPEIKLSFSEWFASKDDMLAEMRRHPVYFAARLREGIGMSFLEAMAMGQVVVGPDVPTLNEYITSGRNGILLDLESEIPAGVALTMGELQRMSDAVLLDVSRGRKQWLEDRERLVAAIKRTDIVPRWDSGAEFSEFIRNRAGARRISKG